MASPDPEEDGSNVIRAAPSVRASDQLRRGLVQVYVIPQNVGDVALAQDSGESVGAEKESVAGLDFHHTPLDLHILRRAKCARDEVGVREVFWDGRGRLSRSGPTR